MHAQPIQNTNQAVSIHTLGQAVDYYLSLSQETQTEFLRVINQFKLANDTNLKSNQSYKKRTAGTLKGKVVFADDFDDLYCGEK
ncbi:MAG: hypothetical protein Q4B88_02825 [Moraxella sp.]|nr:hypothetical protein [Moraxella sp.]